MGKQRKKLNPDRKRRFYSYWFRIYNNYNCIYCNKTTIHYPGEKVGFIHDKRTIDHVVPACLGGTNSRENLVLACEECNNLKSKIEKEEYDTQCTTL